MSTPEFSASLRAIPSARVVEADDDRLGGERQVHVGLGDATHRAVDDVHLTSSVESFCQSVGTSAFLRPCTSCLDEQGKHLCLPAPMFSNMFL